ncbi:MAG TPA: SapC family protein [Steroidobacteraceae bacterium]|nr:SapC family protein [Steroidobacteraceae bacterium]
MSRHVLLNNVEHKNLRVKVSYGKEFGMAVGTVPTFPTEFAEILREYPIFFRKDPNTGEYGSVALLGFTREENLFLDGDRWDASYVPGVIARGPFLIGFQERQDGGQIRREPVIHVDLDDKRISETEGERVFLENGGNSRYLDQVARILSGLNDGIAAAKDMFAIFTAMDLIEPVKIDIKFNSGQYEVVGLHTISAQKLRNLSGEQLLELNRSGFLQGAYLVLSSLNNVQRLIDRKQRRDQVQAATVS